MNSPKRDTGDDSRKPRSSISISDTIVCEDEACIGKTDTPQQARSEEPPRHADKKAKPPESSISVGGRSVCTDSECIGKA